MASNHFSKLWKKNKEDRPVTSSLEYSSEEEFYYCIYEL